MNIQERIVNDMKEAMKAKDKIRLEAIRAVKAAFMLANSEKGGAELDTDGEIKILQKLVKQRKEAAETYKANGREELYEKEIAEAIIIEQYLPAQLSEEEIVAQLKVIVAETGAKGPQDMGKVMGVATKHFAGQAEGKVVAAKVKEVLASL